MPWNECTKSQFICGQYSQVVGNKTKGRISKRVFQENKARQIFRKTNISYPLIRTRTCAYQGVRNVCFLENLACFVFLKHPFWDPPFCLIYVCVSGGKKCSFPENLACFVFLKHPFWDSIFCLTYVWVSGGNKCSFFRKFGVLCFLETLVLRFGLLPYNRQFILPETIRKQLGK